MLAQLTHLEAPTWLVGSDADIWTQLDSLSQLRGLELELGSDVPAGAFSSLRHLTRLALGSAGGGRRSIEPAALAGLGQLQHLALSLQCTGEEEGAAAFLQQLGQLTQLSHLELDSCLEHHAPSPAAYSALGASSRLQHLALGLCWLPEEAWQHVFAAERQRSALQELKINFCYIHSRADVEAMVAACPGVQRLALQYVQGQDMEAEPRAMLQLLTPLSGLASLTQLTVTNVEDAAVASVVAQLSGLRQLDLAELVTTLPHVLPHTALRQLTHLSFVEPDDPELYGPNSMRGCTLVNEAPASSPPDVWRQLLNHCQQQDLDLVARHMAWQAAANEAQLEELRQRLDAQEQQSAAHQQQAAGLQQLLQQQAAFRADMARQLADLKQQLVQPR